MKIFRVFVAISGLAAFIVIDPSMRQKATGLLRGQSEQDKAAECLVVSDYHFGASHDLWKAAAYAQINASMGSKISDCIEDGAGLQNANRAALRCLQIANQPVESARIRAFPNGDSSDLSTVKKWANSSYCQKLAKSYMENSISNTERSAIFESSKPKSADIPPAKDGLTYDPSDLETDPGQSSSTTGEKQQPKM